MKTISAVVITKNEEKMIEGCLASLSFCNEIIVVDNGSEDKTSEIAKKMGARVFELKNQDFSMLRNLGLSKSSGEWILYVDADERASSRLREEIQSKVLDNKNNQEAVAFKIKRKNFYFGYSKKNEWPHIERIERLFKKEFLKGWRGKLHESPVVDGKIGELENFLTHYTHEDLASMVEKTLKWSEIEAELRFEANHPKMIWWRFPRVMISAFVNSYFKEGGWKVGTAGLVESIYQAFSIFITYARLWEMQNRKEK